MKDVLIAYSLAVVVLVGAMAYTVKASNLKMPSIIKQEIAHD